MITTSLIRYSTKRSMMLETSLIRYSTKRSMMLESCAHLFRERREHFAQFYRHFHKSIEDGDTRNGNESTSITPEF